MLTLNGVTDNRVAILHAAGTVTKDDIKRVEPALENELSHAGPLHFYIELDDFSGMEIGAALEDFQFDRKHKDRYGKIAIVGDKRWQDALTRVSDHVLEAPVRFFDQECANDAWRWLNS